MEIEATVSYKLDNAIVGDKFSLLALEPAKLDTSIECTVSAYPCYTLQDPTNLGNKYLPGIGDDVDGVCDPDIDPDCITNLGPVENPEVPYNPLALCIVSDGFDAHNCEITGIEDLFLQGTDVYDFEGVLVIVDECGTGARARRNLRTLAVLMIPFCIPTASTKKEVQS